MLLSGAADGVLPALLPPFLSALPAAGREHPCFVRPPVRVHKRAGPALPHGQASRRRRPPPRRPLLLARLPLRRIAWGGLWAPSAQPRIVLCKGASAGAVPAPVSHPGLHTCCCRTADTYPNQMLEITVRMYLYRWRKAGEQGNATFTQFNLEVGVCLLGRVWGRAGLAAYKVEECGCPLDGGAGCGGLGAALACSQGRARRAAGGVEGAHWPCQSARHAWAAAHERSAWAFQAVCASSGVAPVLCLAPCTALQCGYESGEDRLYLRLPTEVYHVIDQGGPTLHAAYSGCSACPAASLN